MIATFLEWLGNTSWSVRLLESLYAWPLIESTHVLTIGLFVGTAVMMDLRLVGLAFRSVPVSEFTGRVLPWTRVGFAILAVTGMLIFFSAPLRYYYNVFFRIKLLLLMVAGLNVFVFHRRIHETVTEWDTDPVPPRAARIAGVVSLFSWALVVVAGRMIAYNWFECDLQPQPGWVNWAAGCVIEGQ